MAAKESKLHETLSRVKYLKENDIHFLLEEMCHELLAEQPRDALGFLINLLEAHKISIGGCDEAPSSPGMLKDKNSKPGVKTSSTTAGSRNEVRYGVLPTKTSAKSGTSNRSHRPKPLGKNPVDGSGHCVQVSCSLNGSSEGTNEEEEEFILLPDGDEGETASYEYFYHFFINELLPRYVITLPGEPL